jgi:hypothetical protein
MMAFCTNCGTQMADGVNFCTSCGTAIGGTATPQPTTIKAGNIQKCPACGAPVESFQGKCPSCGHEFRDVKVSNSVQAFFEKLDKLDQNMAAMGDTGVNSGFLGMGGGISPANQRKLELIKNYPIPTTKEDLLEFIILAASHVESNGPSMFSGSSSNYRAEKGVFDAKNNAWRAKIDQAKSKALIAFAGDSATLNQINAITTSLDAKVKGASRKRIIIIVAIVVAVVGGYGGLFAGLMAPASKETKRLNAIVTEITRDIEAGNLDGAHLKASQLQWGTDMDSGSNKPLWNQKREALLQEIETLQKKK